MKLAGFNFTKINAEKFLEKAEKSIKVNVNIDVLSIKEVKSGFFISKENLIGVDFFYNVTYGQEFAKVEIEGKLLLAVESKVVKDVLNQWKDKKIPEDFKINLFNLILSKASLKALQLEEELGLPFHLPLPTLRKQDNSKDL